MPYLNVAEVESALQLAAAGPNSGFTQLITLPHRTWEGRLTRAIRISANLSASRPGVYLIGGVHAREWGSPDILVSFTERLLEAYRTGAGIELPGRSFAAADVQRIVTGLDIVVFPQVNPDGRQHSMTPDGDEMWRKNRRPTAEGSPCAGVDVNRNYDWLWDYPRYFHPSADVANSTRPCDNTYIGSAAFSEPETRNVAWILDNTPGIRFFVDVHSFSELVLYPWGDDDNQNVTPSMNFRNASHDGQRGLLEATHGPAANAYREYITLSDERALVELARRMQQAIEAVNGRRYTVQQGAALYPTAGTSEDYAYARHLVDPSRPKIYPFVIEWGQQRPSLAESFHPPYAEMVQIIDECVAGLLEFCLAALDQLVAEQLDSVDPGKWAQLVEILFGVTSDGGGVVLGSDGRPVPIGPWDPLRGLAPAKQQLLAGLVATRLAALVDSPAARQALHQAGLEAVADAEARLSVGG